MDRQICSHCKQREAIYYRTYSGEYLCKRCLHRALEKSIRKSISQTRILKPNTKILLPITFSNPLYAIILSEFIPKIEGEYNVKTLIAVPKIFSSISIKEQENTEIIAIEIEPPTGKENTDPFYCWRYDRAWSYRIAEEYNAKTILLPLTRTDLNLLMIEATLRGEEWLLSESLPILNTDEIAFISALNHVEGEIVAAYALSRKLYSIPRPCRIRMPHAKSLFYSIARGRPELEFSAFKSVNLLYKGLVSKTPKVCSVCKGFMPQGEICPYCEKYIDKIK